MFQDPRPLLAQRAGVEGLDCFPHQTQPKTVRVMMLVDRSFTLFESCEDRHVVCETRTVGSLTVRFLQVAQGVFDVTPQNEPLSRFGKIRYGLAALLLGLPIPVVLIAFLAPGCNH